MSDRVFNPLPDAEKQGSNGADALDYSCAILTAPQLNALDVPKRPALLGAWMREADIGFLFAPRGVGKTWVAMLIGNAIAEGVRLGEWEAGENSRGVLYVDCEMSLADSQERARAIDITSPRFRWLHHERLFAEDGKTINIANAGCQSAISALLEPGDVFILDNLSAASRGVEENSNDDWEAFLPWLLALRRRKVTVILIHHAGRNGEMRGGSRREDAADWILRLRDDTGDDDERAKAFVAAFTKCRGTSPKQAMPTRWTLDISNGRLAYTCAPHSGPDALVALVKDGVDTNHQCADMLGVAPGTVSKWAKKLHEGGRIRIVGRSYQPAQNDPEE